MTLEQFTLELKKDEMWVEAMRNPSRGKSLAAAIEKVYGQVVSDGTLKIKPITEHRKHIFNTLCVQKFCITTGIQLQQEAPKEEKKEVSEVPSVPYEVHQKRLQDLLDTIAKIPAIKRIPKLTAKQIQEEGDWEPKRERNYIQDKTALFRHKMKIEYGKLFSNPYSHEGRLMPGSPSFEDWLEEQIKLHVPGNESQR